MVERYGQHDLSVLRPQDDTTRSAPRGSARRLVLLFDGTWNKREDSTNVWRMRLLVKSNDEQIVYYDEGVGTKEGEEFEGGAFGKGVTRKILQGYLWLMENYRDADDSPNGTADELFVMGFSRGAFIARSLVGVLAISGLLHRSSLARVKDVFELSRVHGITETSVAANTFRRANSREVAVRFLGVWDTVESLGFPQVQIPFWEKSKERRFSLQHKVRDLPNIVLHARQALALDEHRFIFDAMLWHKANEQQTLEQRWFIGAHANVGGGYDRDALFVRPLQWLANEAIAQGLVLQEAIPRLPPEFYLVGPRDSLDEVFLGGYYLSQRFQRHYRRVRMTGPTSEHVDFTVLQRWLWDRTYRPEALRKERLLPAVARRPSSANAPVSEIRDLLGPYVTNVSPTLGFRLQPTGDQQ